jgi:hypothetical protein
VYHRIAVIVHKSLLNSLRAVKAKYITAHFCRREAEEDVGTKISRYGVSYDCGMCTKLTLSAEKPNNIHQALSTTTS